MNGEVTNVEGVQFGALRTSSDLLALVDHGLREWAIDVFRINTESEGLVEPGVVRARDSDSGFLSLGGLAALDVRSSKAFARVGFSSARRSLNAASIIGGRNSALQFRT